MKKNNDILPITSPTLRRRIGEDLRARHEGYYIIYRLILDTGIYLGPLLDYRVSDLRNADYVTVHSRKTKEARKVNISKSLLPEIRDFLKDRNDDEFAFVSRHTGERLNYGTYKYILRSVSVQFGIDPPLTVSSLVKTHTYLQYLEEPTIIQKKVKHKRYSDVPEYFGLKAPEEPEDMLTGGSIKQTFYKENTVSKVKADVNSVLRAIIKNTERPDIKDNEYFRDALKFLHYLDSLLELYGDRLKK